MATRVDGEVVAAVRAGREKRGGEEESARGGPSKRVVLVAHEWWQDARGRVAHVAHVACAQTRLHICHAVREYCSGEGANVGRVR